MDALTGWFDFNTVKPHPAWRWCDSQYRWSRDNGWAEMPVVGRRVERRSCSRQTFTTMRSNQASNLA
jgi:hypothetical protein